MANRPANIQYSGFPQKIGQNNLVNSTYIVEFASDTKSTDYLNSLVTYCNVSQTNIKQRRQIASRISSFVSFTISGRNDIEVMERVSQMPDIIGIYPVYSIQIPELENTSLELGALDLVNVSSVMSHDLTGVKQVHENLTIFGKGVKVRISR